jgi:hypothetical protein
VLLKHLILHICAWFTLLAVAGCGEQVVYPLATPAGAHSSSPNFSTDSRGRPVLSWQRKEQTTTVLEYSVLFDDGWSKPVEVARGTDWFVNWADIPAVLAVNDSFWVAHYLQRTSGGTFAYDVQLRLSNDGGQNWRDAGSPHTDGTLTEHGFVSLYAHGNELGLVWLDGRETTQGGHAEAHGADHGGMTLRSAYMNAQGKLTQERQIDGLVCDCCQTAAVMTKDTPLVIYRDRDKSEIRDIASSRLLKQGWTSPEPVAVDGWLVNGCPVNGPVAVARGNDVAVVWFSGADELSQIFFSRSIDGGISFDRKLKVNKHSALGRVAAVMYPDRSLWLTWMREDARGKAWIVGRHISADNAFGPVRELVEVSSERQSGFPKLSLFGSEAVLAWTALVDSSPQVRTLIVDKNATD